MTCGYFFRSADLDDAHGGDVLRLHAEELEDPHVLLLVRVDHHEQHLDEEKNASFFTIQGVPRFRVIFEQS